MSDEVVEEREELRRLVRRFSQEKSSSAQVRTLIDDGSAGDPAVWSLMADELGLTSIPIPEEYGGAGYGAIELGIVLEEFGGALLVSPYFSTVALAAQTLLAFDDEDAKMRWLPQIADGSLTATVAILEEDGHWAADAPTTRATRTAHGWRLTGSKLFVSDGADAGLVLVVATTDEGRGLFAVERDAVGMSSASMDALDLTRPLARLEFSDTPAHAVGDAASFDVCFARAQDAIAAAVSAEQVGGAARCLEMAVEYAKVRVQFERPIGSFQAIKSMCVEMLLKIESARSASAYASAAVASRSADARESTAVAKAAASIAFTHAAKENIQIHGGIGYTWEHDAHLLLRRAKSSELQFGTPREHRERLAEAIGIRP